METVLDSNYAEATYHRMLAKGMDQKALAESARLDRETVSRILRGHIAPTEDQKSKIDAALGVEKA